MLATYITDLTQHSFQAQAKRLLLAQLKWHNYLQQTAASYEVNVHIICCMTQYATDVLQ